MDKIKVNWNLRSYSDDYDQLSASVWIRCLQLIPYLRALGIESTINRPGEDAQIELFVRNQDKNAFRLAKKLAKIGKPLVFDLVVNYFDVAPNVDGDAGSYQNNVDECKRMVELADAVTCCSEFIRERAGHFHDNPIYIPDSVDRCHFRFQKNTDDFEKEKLTAVWSGVSKKTTEIKALYPLLREKNIRLVVISDKRPELPGPYTFIPWSYHTFPGSILEGDLCIAPRRLDNEYNKGHSNFKVGVFMAQGVPACGAPLPSYREIIGGANPGRICNSIEEWDKALGRIKDDRELLKIWSKQAYKTMTPYTTEVVVNKYAELFRYLHQ